MGGAASLSARRAMDLEQIYNRHADFVWRTLRRLGVPESDVSDATQEVFLTVHRTLASFEGRCSMTTWLFTICRGVASDRRRKAYVRHEVADIEALAASPDDGADVGAAAEHRQRLALLDRALASLPVEQREAFVLFEIEGLAGDEIAAALGVPTATVYSRLRLGRAAFRQFLARHEAHERFATAVKGEAL